MTHWVDWAVKPQHKQTKTNNTEDVHEEPQSQDIAYQRHQEEEQTNQERQYTSHKPKKKKKKQISQLLLPQQGDHNTRQDPLNTTRHRIEQITKKAPWRVAIRPHREQTCTTALERSVVKLPNDLHRFHWQQTFSLGSNVVKQKTWPRTYSIFFRAQLSCA